jgi:hypothetical protein
MNTVWFQQNCTRPHTSNAISQFLYDVFELISWALWGKIIMANNFARPKSMWLFIYLFIYLCDYLYEEQCGLEKSALNCGTENCHSIKDWMHFHSNSARSCTISLSVCTKFVGFMDITLNIFWSKKSFPQVYRNVCESFILLCSLTKKYGQFKSVSW